MTKRTALDNPILAEHAAEIRRLGKQTVENVVEIGRRLVEAKEIAGHGNWLPWLDREFGWSPSTAENYINLFKLSAKFPTVGNLDLDLRSLYLLAAPSIPPEARDEVLARAEAGEQVTVAEVKTAIAKRKPEPKAKLRGPFVNPECLPLFENEDQVDAFCDAVTTKAAKRFISRDQQLELAKSITESFRKRPRGGRVRYIKGIIASYVSDAARAQSKIDTEETEELHKRDLGAEIKDRVAAAEKAVRDLIDALLKLEELMQKFPGHPFFGGFGGSTLDAVINMIRQYRRAAGEHSADEIERKLVRLQELEDKSRRQEIIIEGLHSEVEELRAKLAATGIGGGEMSIGEFQATIKKWEDAVETQKNIIRDRDNEIANLKGAR
jgi:Protein of unknown function (DUF3102)